jgi:hypothetical protein
MTPDLTDAELDALEALERNTCLFDATANLYFREQQIKDALAALRSLPELATDGEIRDLCDAESVPRPDKHFRAGFRAGEQFARRKILGE